MKKNLIIDIVLVIILIICVISCVVVDNMDKKSVNTNNVVSENKDIDNLIIADTNVDTETDMNNTNSDIVVETDDDLVEYIEDVELRVDNIVSKDEISKNEENVLRNTFITLTDFIFYDGEKKKKKFSDITDSCKEKIIDIYTKIDSKIESKYPNYKEKIKDTSKKAYNGVVEKAKEVKESIKNKYKNYVGEDNYNSTVEEYEDDKQSMKDVYDTYKPYVEKGKEKAKSGYNKVKEKVSEWYKNYKENGD